MNTVYWLRNDLRLHDNESLNRATENSDALLMVYIVDPRQFRELDIGFRKTGYLRFRFLIESLQNLRDLCRAKGNELLVKVGKPEEWLPKLMVETASDRLIYQQEVTSEERKVEEAVRAELDDTVLVEPVWGLTLYHLDDAPFTPEETPLTSKAFRIRLTKAAEVRPAFPVPERLPPPPLRQDFGELPDASRLGFEDDGPTDTLPITFQGGESEALKRLNYYTFESERLTSYRWTRNRSLGSDYSSRFSPWLALGCLSPRRIYWTVKDYEQKVKKNASTWWLVFELVWRDYFKFLGLRFGDSIFSPGGYRQREVEWKYDPELFERWKKGQTGIPFVDAHMRELNQTGFMSNRGRVNCASFLSRDYQIDWRWGAAWFEKQLLDYDVCSNWLNWNIQATEIWYTNPVHQGLKYDKEGEYVRRWIAELEAIHDPAVQAPWLLSPEDLEQLQASDYPAPLEVYKKWTRSINNIRKASKWWTS